MIKKIFKGLSFATVISMKQGARSDLMKNHDEGGPLSAGSEELTSSLLI